MNRTFVALTIALAVSTSAAAQSQSRAYQSPYQYNWSGFYIGGHGGYGSARVRGYYDAPAFTYDPSANIDGAVVGLHAGYNHQFQNLVFGIEGDVESTGIKRTYGTAATVLEKLDGGIMSSVRGRIGIAYERVLIYGTGGASFIKPSYTISGGGITVKLSEAMTGWNAGGGVEFAMNDHMTLRAEYRVSAFEKTWLNVIAARDEARLRIDHHALRAGVSYKF